MRERFHLISERHARALDCGIERRSSATQSVNVTRAKKGLNYVMSSVSKASCTSTCHDHSS